MKTINQKTKIKIILIHFVLHNVVNVFILTLSENNFNLKLITQVNKQNIYSFLLAVFSHQ